jgi:hypothetical protein
MEPGGNAQNLKFPLKVMANCAIRGSCAEYKKDANKKDCKKVRRHFLELFIDFYGTTGVT